MSPKTEWEKNVSIEPSPNRSVQLPDGRLMAESRLTLSKEWIEQIWQGYRCAACLEEVTQHGCGAFPPVCPAPFCSFPMKTEQRARIERDFIEQVEGMQQEGWLDREMGVLERVGHVPKVQIVSPSDIRRQH